MFQGPDAGPALLTHAVEETDGLRLLGDAIRFDEGTFILVGSDNDLRSDVAQALAAQGGTVLSSDDVPLSREGVLPAPLGEQNARRPDAILLIHRGTSDRAAVIEPLSVKSTLDWLSRFGLPELARAELASEESSAIMRHLARQRTTLRELENLAAATPGYLLQIDAAWRAASGAVAVRELVRTAVSGLRAPAGLGPAEVAAVRELQLMAERVYGRLEAERAVAWTIEELGELAQVMRRDEGAGRVLEELGQLFCWMLCLANITGCDLGRGAQLAMQREVERQMAKYGALRPYDPEASRAA